MLYDRRDQKDEVMKRLNAGKDEQIKDDLNEIYNYLIYRKDTMKALKLGYAGEAKTKKAFMHQVAR